MVAWASLKDGGMGVFVRWWHGRRRPRQDEQADAAKMLTETG
eukprot:CAMPEP_0180301958 /NCGR_PEP_ID=MMETSP0988-20121125/23889_1 /TAXON_ID=697907 /ORGANISM="non described non described, Strain CCMP2293" /LENGTH=41 /DNA_ID= /DNA_START= /DNA_END= /DNA_ORIENTATION=